MRYFLFSFAFLFSVASSSFAQWSQQKSNVNVALLGVRFTSPTNGFAVGDGGTILRTTDGGTTWTQVTSPTSAELSKVSFSDSTDGWIVGGGGLILQTTDGGNSWQYNNDACPYQGQNNNYSISCVNSGGNASYWIGGGNRGNGLTFIEQSPGNGSWSPQILGFAGRVAGIYFLNDSLGWAAGDYGLVLSTTNGGKWWNEQTTNVRSYLNDIGFFNSKVGVCVGDSGRILRTTDGGSTWAMVQSNPETDLFKVCIVNDSIGYVAGGPYSSTGPTDYIYRTTDAGKTWTNQTVEAPKGTVFEDITFVGSWEGWAVAPNGVIVHTTDGGLEGAALQEPLLVAPATGDTISSKDTALVWLPVPQATGYELQISSDSSFSNVVVDSTGITDTTLALAPIVNTKLTFATKYFWRVEGTSATAPGTFSETWSFITPEFTSVQTSQAGTPRTFELSQNYPNPFNPSTTIKYSIPKAEFVNLSVYDVLGEEVATLVNQRENAGYYQVTFNADRFASGVYFYVLKAGAFTATHKMVPLK